MNWDTLLTHFLSLSVSQFYFNSLLLWNDRSYANVLNNDIKLSTYVWFCDKLINCSQFVEGADVVERGRTQ